ncbi:MAG: gluconate 2-dehydrogenase subunit 3 family protein [Bacteroidota bacterium]
MAIDRREALKKTAMIMGGVLSAPSVVAILDGCTARPELSWTPNFFTEEQAGLVMELAEDIIPQTATPGAKALEVPQFIEEMVSTRFLKQEQDKFMTGLVQFDQECFSSRGTKYVELSSDDRLEFLKIKNSEINKKLHHASFTPDKKKTFFWEFKELTLLGYFTTEVGATMILQYKAIPIEYNPCVPLYEVGGRTWATS